MNLKELLASKTKQPIKQVNKTEDKIDYLYTGTKKEVDQEIFLTAWSLQYLFPFSPSTDIQPLVSFFLDENFYILNTFIPLDKEVLFSTYMEYSPPRTAYELHLLWCKIAYLSMYIPHSYQDRIVDRIKEKFKLTKILECGKI